MTAIEALDRDGCNVTYFRASHLVLQPAPYAARSGSGMLVASGLSNEEIATRLVLSEHTAKTHVAHILRKLNLRDRTQVVVVAYESGVVEPGSS